MRKKMWIFSKICVSSVVIFYIWEFWFGSKEEKKYFEQMLVLNYQVILFKERIWRRHCQPQRKRSVQASASESELCRALRMCSHSPCNHFKNKILKSLNAKLPNVTRIKKQFQNQPCDSISIERLPPKRKPSFRRLKSHLLTWHKH